jgi:hypothetical protein
VAGLKFCDGKFTVEENTHSSRNRGRAARRSVPGADVQVLCGKVVASRDCQPPESTDYYLG